MRRPAALGAASVLAAIVSTSLLSAPTALGASVTIGPDATGTVATQVGLETKSVQHLTFVQVSQPTAGILLTAPADGVITSWRVRGSATLTGSLALRVARRAPDGVDFTGGASSLPITGSSPGAVDHPTNIPIQAGEYIGVEEETKGSTADSEAFVSFAGATGATVDDWGGTGLPNGTTSAPIDNEPDLRLLANATESLRASISGVSPPSGSTSGGQAVTITGSNLDETTAVSFGGVPATSFTAAASQITATAPAHAPGTVDVHVSGPGGTSPTTSAASYQYVTPAPVTTISGPLTPALAGPMKPTAGQIKAGLLAQLKPTGKGAKIASLKSRKSYSYTFNALSAGALSVNWYFLPKGARVSRASKPVLVASGGLSFPARVSKTLTIKLTARGKRLLRHASAVKLTAKGVFTPAGGTPVAATNSFALKN
jgi:hypothetical protein